MLAQERQDGSARGALPRCRDGVLEIEDKRIGLGAKRLVELFALVAWNEEQRAHHSLRASGRFFMNAWRRQTATSVSSWLKHLCSNSTMPASGRDFDSRLPMTKVVTCTVSPWKSGCGKRTSLMPRLAIVV